MKNIDKTLTEQLQITEREINKRKALLNFTEKDVVLLKKAKPMVESYIDAVVNQFYDHQTAFADIALVIGDAETLRRLKAAMRNYILELFDGYYDVEYVNRRLRIGKIHERIGVSPKLYISAIYQLQKIVFKAIEMHKYDNMLDQDVRDLLDALQKILMFDTQLVFDTYISSLVSAVESAKDELETYAEGLEEQVAERTEQLKELASRDELTGLYNRRGMYENLRREIAVAERYQENLSIAYFDMNGFKILNDTEGHKAGDELLMLVGKTVRESIRTVDIGCRFGGDEFCIIMPRTKLQDAFYVIERFIEKFKSENTTNVSFSVGIASTVAGEITDADQLLKSADAEMYKAKTRARKKPDYHICVEKQA